MLRTNLATRPFYNVRAVQMALGALALIVLAVTIFNVVQAIRLSSSERTLGTHAQEAEAEAARLQMEAARMRAQINPRELDEVAAAAREANTIIDRRTFSWTELLARLETTLPRGVRITRVQPREQQRSGRFDVVIDVQARSVEDLNTFFEALEADGAFRQVLPPQQQTTDDGLIQAVVTGLYVPARDGAAPDAETAAAAPAANGGPRE